MANCLVTRLKESIPDDSLLKVGEIRFIYEDNVTQVTDDNHDLFTVKFKSNTMVSVLEGGPCLANKTLPQDSMEIESGTDNLWLAANKGTVISIANKYALNRFYCDTEGIPVYSHQVDFFDPSLAQFVAKKFFGSVDVLSRYSNISMLGIQNPESGLQITGNLKSFRNIKDLLVGTPQQPVDITGDVKDLDISPTGLTIIKFRSISTYGRIESVVEKICDLGYTNLSNVMIYLEAGNGYPNKVTLNGNPIRDQGYILQVTADEATLYANVNSVRVNFGVFNRSTRTWTYGD